MDEHFFSPATPSATEAGVGHFFPIQAPTPRMPNETVSWEELQRNRERFGFSLSNREATRLENIIRSSNLDPERKGMIRRDMIQAAQIADLYDLSFDDVYQNLEQVRRQLFPEAKNIETWEQTLDKAVKQGNLSRQLVSITNKFRSISNPTPEQEQAFLDELENVNKQLIEYAKTLPDGWFMRDVGMTLESLVLLGNGMILGGLAAATAVGVSVLFPPAAPIAAKVAPIASTALAGLANFPVYSALSYADMYKVGIRDQNILNRYSNMTASQQVLLESVLGYLPTGSLASAGTQYRAKRVAIKITASGAARRLAEGSALKGLRGAVGDRIAKQATLEGLGLSTGQRLAAAWAGHSAGFFVSGTTNAIQTYFTI